jgi:hypothetical protein
MQKVLPPTPRRGPITRSFSLGLVRSTWRNAPSEAANTAATKGSFACFIP